jgi:hypothetical protein
MDVQLMVNDFIETYKPDLNRYVEKDIRGNVFTVKRPLTNKKIMFFFGDVSSYRLSFFVRGACRNYIGLDIDDHEFGGWIGDVPTEFLREKYCSVINEIVEPPSAIFKSPRGIHAFWFLTKSLSNKVIEDILKARFQNKGVEVLPTMHHALAIPRPMDYLNSSLEPAIFPGYKNIRLYDPSSILGQACLPDSIKKNYKSGKTAGGIYRGRGYYEKSIEDIETEYLPLENGRTNETYKYLVGVYKARGLNPAQIVERFRKLVAKSPAYSGNLLRGIEARVDSSYRNLKGTMGTMEMGSMGILYGEPEIRRIIEDILTRENINSPKRIRMKNAHTDFLLQLFSWKRAYDRLQADPEKAAYWDHLYPNSLYYSKQGYFPLPYNLLREWNVHYDEHLRLLKKHGILKESPYGYSTTQKRCKHYRLTIDISPAQN